MSVSKATTMSTAAAQLEGLSDAEKRELLAQLLRDKAAGARVFDMSIGQAALWHAFQRNPNSTAYSVFLPTRIRSHLNAAALKACIEQLAARHQCLRTSFEQSDGRLLQRVHGELKPGYVVRDVAGASEEQIENLVLEEAMRPFDLEAGPLVRLSVFKVADDDWVILAQAHHIVVDFWSLVIILSELRVLYPQLLAGQPATLPPPQNNYQRFVNQQNELLASKDAQRHLDYWESALKDVAPIVELPLDRQRPEGFTGRANVQGIEFPADLGQKVAELARDQRATPFAVVHAAVQLFISRLSRQDLFFIGSPFSGRSQREYEQTVGFFVNVLPVRCDLRNAPTFAELVARTGQNLADALDHESYPLSEIVRIGDVPRDASRSPLFQVSCTFEKSQKKEESGRGGFLFPGETQAWQFGGMRQESFFLPHPTCHYDLEFVFELNDDRLKGMMVYCRDLFSAESMANLSGAFSSLFQEAVRDPDTAAAALNWSGETPAIALPTGAPDSSAQPTAEDTLPGQILSAAVDAPDENALVHGENVFTYRQMVSAATELAQVLESRGVDSEVLVPVACQPGPAAMIGMLAVHLAGGAPVPVDSTQPHATLSELVSETNAPVIVSDKAEIGDCGVPLAVVKLPAPNSGELSDEELSGLQRATLAISPRSLAYMVYTSGSTGRPKGVLVEHRAVCNTLTWRRRAVPLNSSDRVLYTLSHQFDAGLGIAWAALTQGACLVWASDVSDPSQMIGQIKADSITVLPAVPSVHELLVAHPDFVNCKSLRYIWTGGESMASTLPEKIRRLTQAAFWNFYGPTEAAIEATACDVTAHPANKPVTIGRPIDSVDVRILDANHREVPECVPGQIAIGGVGLARGYHNDASLTAEKFIEGPYGRLYLTGDYGRKLADGQIQFLGRDDHQVKLRGYRIELGEIEATIAGHPAIQQVAVVVCKPDTPNAFLVAYVTRAASDDDAPEASLEQFAARRLPHFKRPAGFIVLDAMPMTASGKVDRRQLSTDVELQSLGQECIPPEGPLEEFLHEAWRETLEIENLGVNQNFFEVGGSSIGAATLTTRLTDELGVHVPTALLFDLADIRQMACRLIELHEQTIRDRFGVDAIEVGRKYSRDLLLPSLITPLRATGQQRPLFLIHPPGGIVACYRDLASGLPDDQPVYAIRARGLHGRETLPSSIEEMAADYIGAIQEIQPQGPYVLGGWSLGGLVAYEAARQLIAAGEEVDRLVMLDTTIPEDSTDLVPLAERENVGLEYGIELTLRELGELDPEQQLQMLFEHAQKLGVLEENSPPEVIAQVIEDLQHLFHHHVDLSTRYRLAPLDVRCLLIRPREMPIQRNVAHDRGWGHLLSEVDVHMVPGHHHSMVQPPAVTKVATILTHALKLSDIVLQ